MTIIYATNQEFGFGDELARRAADPKTLLTPNETQKTTLIVAGCYIIGIAILWYVIVFGYEL